MHARDNSAFDRYIGIDYSGAQTSMSSLSGLRVYVADRNSLPVEMSPPLSPKKHWTRRGIAEWLVEVLREDRRTLIGIDHGFSFPFAYFDEHHLQRDWSIFLEDFQHYWPTDVDDISVDLVRKGLRGKGSSRYGNARWRRVTERRAGAKSVFHFDVPGSVATSTHAGLPWLRYIRQQVPSAHFWPFDGWTIPVTRSAVVEVYPALWSAGYTKEDRNNDQHDAFSVAAWMRRADSDGSLQYSLKPSLAAGDQKAAEVEGWILGVM
jgi:hypothetical protein